MFLVNVTVAKIRMLMCKVCKPYIVISFLWKLQPLINNHLLKILKAVISMALLRCCKEPMDLYMNMATWSTKITWAFVLGAIIQGEKLMNHIWTDAHGIMLVSFYRIWIKLSRAMVFIFKLDKVLLKKLFPTMNI